MSLKIFLSYSTCDMKWVDQVRTSLRGSDADVFVAEYNIHPGEILDARIKDALTKCDLFLVLWSPDARDSEWVAQEIGIAEGLNKTIVPIVLDKEVPLPGFIKNRKYLTVGDDFSSIVSSLHEIIAIHMQKPGGMSPLAALLFGAGIGWLLAKASESDDEEYVEEVVEYRPTRRGYRR